MTPAAQLLDQPDLERERLGVFGDIVMGVQRFFILSATHADDDCLNAILGRARPERCIGTKPLLDHLQVTWKRSSAI